MTSSQTKLHLPQTMVGWVIGTISLLVVLIVAILLLAPRGAFLLVDSLSRADVAWLPRFNASLNAISAILLSAAYFFIRRKQIKRHRFCMLTAFGSSALFLISYVVYHAIVGSTQFTGSSWLRPIYFAVLISHITLAILVLPLVLTTLYRAQQGAFIQHRGIGRWTLPIWLYVSVSGVAVYLFLYHWNLY